MLLGSNLFEVCDRDRFILSNNQQCETFNVCLGRPALRRTRRYRLMMEKDKPGSDIVVDNALERRFRIINVTGRKGCLPERSTAER